MLLHQENPEIKVVRSIWPNVIGEPGRIANSEVHSATTTRLRIQRRIIESVYGAAIVSDVRGAGVAVDNLISLFTGSLAEQSWVVNVTPDLLDSARRWSDARQIPHGSSLRIAALPRSFHDQDVAPKLWCDLNLLSLPKSLWIRHSTFLRSFPIVALAHTLSVPSMLNSIVTPILTRGMRSYDRIVCSTRTSADALASVIEYQRSKLNELGAYVCNDGVQPSIVPIPTDTNRFTAGDRQEARKKIGLPRKAFVIVYFGYIGLLKADLSAYLEGFKALIERNRGREIIWCVAGTADTAYMNFLRQRVRDLGLKRNVYIEINVSSTDKVSFYQAADLFVSPSDTVQESFGMTVVEAMACGIPQVVSDWNGYRELVVHGETGFRVKTLWADCTDEFRMPYEFEEGGRDHVGLGQSVSVDLEDWYRSIETLLLNEDLRRRMGEASRRRAVELYSNAVVAGMHRELWREVQEECAGQDEAIAYKQELSAPDYFRCFGHYASELVNDTTLLMRTELGDSALAGEIERYRTLPAMDSLLDPQLVNALLAQFAGKSASMGDVCGKAMEQHPATASTARRHVMWLIKHGFVRVAQSDGSVTAA